MNKIDIPDYLKQTTLMNYGIVKGYKRQMHKTL